MTSDAATSGATVPQRIGRALRRRLGGWRSPRASFPGCDIAPDAWVHPESRLPAGTVVGRRTRINGPAHVRPGAVLSIGAFCAVAHELRVVTRNHTTDLPSQQVRLLESVGIGADEWGVAAPVDVGNDVWIGDGVTILPGVTLGDGAVVGAGSIVTHDVASWAIVAGSPARRIRDRCDDAVKAELASIRWWDWTDDEILERAAFFRCDLTSSTPEQLRAAARQP